MNLSATFPTKNHYKMDTILRLRQRLVNATRVSPGREAQRGRYAAREDLNTAAEADGRAPCLRSGWQRGVRRPRGSQPGVESLFWLTRARAHAANGSSRQAREALRTAEKLISEDPGEQGPPWAALGGPAEARLAHQAGKTLQALRDLPAAQEQLTRAVGCWNPVTHPRVLCAHLAPYRRHGSKPARRLDARAAQMLRHTL